ncbi:hypothetical protein X975_25215, partial [Stegodyphus mimosarum]
MPRIRIQAVLENKNSTEINNIKDYTEILKLIRENNVHATSFVSRYNTWSSKFHISLENTNAAKEISLKSIHPSYFMRFLATAFFTLCLIESVRCKNQFFLDIALTFCIILLIMSFVSSFILFFSASPNQLVKTMILYSNAVKTIFSDFKLRLNRAGRKFKFLPRPNALVIVNNFLTSLSLLHLILTPLSSLSEWYLLHGSLFSACLSIIFNVLDYETAPERIQIEIIACSLLLLLALLQDRKVQNNLAEIKLQLICLESECRDFLLWFEEKCYLKRLLEESGFYKAEMLELFTHEIERSSVLEKPLLCFVTFFVAAESCLPTNLHFSNLSNIVSFILYSTCKPNVSSVINIVSKSNKGESDSRTPKIHSLYSSNVLQEEAFVEANVPQACSLLQVPPDAHETLDKRNGQEMFPTFVPSSPQVFLADELSPTDVKNTFSCVSKNEVLNDETGIYEFEHHRENPLVQEDQIFTNNVNLLKSGIANNEFTCEKCVFPRPNTSKQDDRESKKYEENAFLSNLNSSSSFLQEETLGDDHILKKRNTGIPSRFNAGVRTEINESLKDEQTFQPFAKEITLNKDCFSTDLKDLPISQCKDQAEIKRDSPKKYRSEVRFAQNYKLQSQNGSQPEDVPRNASTFAERLQAKDSFLLNCSELSQRSEETIKNSVLINDVNQLLTVENENQSNIVRDEPITNENERRKAQALNYNGYLQIDETSELQVQKFAVSQESEEDISSSNAVCEEKQLTVEKLESQLDILKAVLQSINGIVDNLVEVQEFSRTDDTIESKIKQSAVFQVVETEKYLNISEEGNDHRNYLDTVNRILQKSAKNIISETPDRPKVEDFRPDECSQTDEASKLGKHNAGLRKYHIKAISEAECEKTREFENIFANVTPNDVNKQELTRDNDPKIKISDNKEISNITLNNDSPHFKYNGRTRDSEIKVKNSCHMKNQSSSSDVLPFDTVNGDIMLNSKIDGKKALDDGLTTTFSSDYQVDAPSEQKISDRPTSNDRTIDDIIQEITGDLVSWTVKQCPDNQVNYEIRNQSTISENKAEFKLHSVMNRKETPDFDGRKLNQDEQIQISKMKVIQNCGSEDETSVPGVEVESQMNGLSKSVSDFNQETSYKSAVSFHKQANSDESLKYNEPSFSDFNNQNENDTSIQMRRNVQNFFANSRVASEEMEVDVKHHHALNLGPDTNYALIDEFMKRNQKPDISINTVKYISNGSNGNKHTQENSNQKKHEGMDFRHIRRPFVFEHYINEQNTDEVLKLDQKYNTSVNSSIYVNSDYSGAEHKGGISSKNESDRNGLQRIRCDFAFGQEDEQKNRDGIAPIAAVDVSNTKDGKEHKKEISNKNHRDNLLQTRGPYISRQLFKEKKANEIATNATVHVSNSNNGEKNKQEISNKNDGNNLLQTCSAYVSGELFKEKNANEIATNATAHVSNSNNGEKNKQEISNKNDGNNLLQTYIPYVSGELFKEKKANEIATNATAHASNSNNGEKNKQEISNKEGNDGGIFQQIRRPFIFGQETRQEKIDEFLEHNQKYKRSANTGEYLNSTNNADEDQQVISNKKENVKVINVSLRTGNKCNSPTETAKKGFKCRKRLKAKRHYRNESNFKNEENFNLGVTNCPLLKYSIRNDESLPVSNCFTAVHLMEEKSDHLLLRKFNETCQNTSQEPDSRFEISDRNAVFEFKKTEHQVEVNENDTVIESGRKSSRKKRCQDHYASAAEDDEEHGDRIEHGDKVENKQVSPLRESRWERTLILMRNVLNASKTRKFTLFEHNVPSSFICTPKKHDALNNRIMKNSLIREFNGNENCNEFLRKMTDQKSAGNVPSEQVSDEEFANQAPCLDNAECPTVSKGQGNRRKNKRLPIVHKSMEDKSVTLKNEKVLDSAKPRNSTEKEIGKELQCSLLFYSSERVNEFSSSSSLPAGSSEDENFRFHKSTSVCSETSDENSEANHESFSYDLLDADASRTPGLDQTCVIETGSVSSSPKNAPNHVSCDSPLNASRSSADAFQFVNHAHITASESEPKCKTQGGHMAWNTELCDSVESNLISESTYSGGSEMASFQSKQSFQSDENPLRYQLKHDNINLEFLDELSEVTLRIISENDSECVEAKNLLENPIRELKFNSIENTGELLIPEKKSEHKETAFVDYSCLPFEINNEDISICVNAVGEGQPKFPYNSSSTRHSSSSWSTVSYSTDTIHDNNFGETAELSAAGICESKNEVKQKDTESNQNRCLECVEPQCQINANSSAPNKSCDSYLLSESPSMSHLHTSTESQHQSDKNEKTQQKITDIDKINGEEVSWNKISNNLMDDGLQKITTVPEDYQQQMYKEQEQCENELLPPIVDNRKCGLNAHENKNVSKSDIQNISEENNIQTQPVQDMKQSIEKVSEDNMLSESSENDQHPISQNAPFATASADFEPSSVSSHCSSDLTNRNLCLESEKLKFNFAPKPDSGMLEMKYRHAPGITTLIFKSEKEKLYLKLKDPVLP